MIKYFSLLLLVFSPKLTLALECPSSFKAKDVAIEILKLELSGARVDGMSKHKCMLQKNHPYINAVSDPSNEEGSNPKYYIKRNQKLNVEKIELLDADTYTYKVNFSLNVNNEAKKISSSFQFFLYKDKKNQKKYGCGAPLSAPESIIIFEDCR